MDIDVVATVYNRDNLLIHVLEEYKFGKGPAGMALIDILGKREISAKADSNVRFAVFSLGGFTEELEEYALETGTLLIDCGKLLGDDDPEVI